MCYYVLIGTVAISTYTYGITTGNETSKAYQTYFTCQRVGIQPDRDCGDPPHVQLHMFIMLVVAATLQRLLPLIILIFLVNCGRNKRCFKGVRSLLMSKLHISKQSTS